MLLFLIGALVSTKNTVSGLRCRWNSKIVRASPMAYCVHRGDVVTHTDIDSMDCPVDFMIKKIKPPL